MQVEGLLIVPPPGDGFLRRRENGYLSHPRDVSVPRSVVGRFGLRPGWTIAGEAVERRRGKGGAQLETIHSIDGMPVADALARPEFSRMTSVIPSRRFELGGDGVSVRIVDLIAPIARGQRALIVAPPRSGKTVLLQELARAISVASPNAELVILLVDERPEEVTDMRRNVPGTVWASCLDKDPERHIEVVDLVFQQARRRVEEGKDVVIFLDSLTRMARAFNSTTAGTGRTLSGGLDARAMQRPREYFGAGRDAEEGGSLTVIATVLVDTGSKMDQVIFEEFKGTGNMELVLDRRLAERRIYPAIDISKSGTRHEERLRPAEVHERTVLLRRALTDADPIYAMQNLRGRIEKTRNNAEFLETFGE